MGMRCLGIEPSLRLCMITGCGAGERQSRHSIRQLARKRTSDGAKTGDGDAGREHCYFSE